MRDFIIFLAVCALIFFGVGETRGWHVGVLSQTPIFVYKSTSDAEAVRRLTSVDELPFTLSGELRSGTVVLEAYYERPESFQNPTQRILPERRVFERTFRAGQPIDFTDVLSGGRGVYTLRVIFDDATGRVRLNVPDSSDL